MFDGFPNGMRSVAELAENKPHGNRIRYMAGCRCVPCRAANSNYETQRAAARRRGEWNGCVPADRARQHIFRLSDLGIGYKTVADIAMLPTSTVFAIRSGKKKKCRAMTEKKILAVGLDAVNDATLIPAKDTWIKIRWLINEGFTKSEIARRLGSKARTPALQLNKKVLTARNAAKVEKLYNLIRLGE